MRLDFSLHFVMFCQIKFSTWTSNVNSILIDFRRTAVAKERFQCLLMKHAPQRQSMKTNNSKKRLPTVMLGDNPDAPSTRSDLLQEKGSESHLYPLDTVEVDCKLVEVLLTRNIPSAEDLHKSSQQQDLSGRS